MATLESPILNLEECLQLEDKVLALGGDLTVLENYYREMVERHPDVGGGAQLIDGLGLVFITPRLASVEEVKAGGCSPREALSFFGDSIQGVTLFSDWSHDGSLRETAKTAMSADSPHEFGLSWRCQFAHVPPNKLPDRFWLGKRSHMSLPTILVRKRKSDPSSRDDMGNPLSQTGTIGMSAQMTQDYWKHHPEEFREALEKIRHLPEDVEGWKNATFTDGGDERWGACRLPHHESTDELFDKLTAAAKHCFGDGLSTMEHLTVSHESDADHSINRSRAAAEKLLADIPMTAWSHWEPHQGAITNARTISALRTEISRFPMIFEGEDGITIPISSLEFSGEKILFSRQHKRGGNILSINFLRRRKINPEVHQKLEEAIGIKLTPS